jgi:hypothetical protein
MAYHITVFLIVNQDDLHIIKPLEKRETEECYNVTPGSAAKPSIPHEQRRSQAERVGYHMACGQYK